MQSQSNKVTALYCRLSREDDQSKVYKEMNYCMSTPK